MIIIKLEIVQNSGKKSLTVKNKSNIINSEIKG